MIIQMSLKVWVFAIFFVYISTITDIKVKKNFLRKRIGRKVIGGFKVR